MAVERTRHKQESQGQILALTFSSKSLKPFKLFPLGSDVAGVPQTLYPAFDTIHPAPSSLQPPPSTHHPIPQTPHPAPYTLHPEHYTLQQGSGRSKRRSLCGSAAAESARCSSATPRGTWAQGSGFQGGAVSYERGTPVMSVVAESARCSSATTRGKLYPRTLLFSSSTPNLARPNGKLFPKP